MRPPTAETLRGVWATLLLPLNADDSIDYIRLEAQATILAATELDGLYTHAARPVAGRLLPELFETS